MKKTNQEIQQLKDKTFILTITIPQTDIEHEYSHVLSHASENLDIKGFRKGKAPADVVESHLDPLKLLEQVAQNLISDIYEKLIKKHDLKPIIQPQIKILNPPITKNTDWEVEITGCELPEVKLDGLEDKIKKINSESPKAEVKKTKAGKENEQKPEPEKKMDKIFDAILTTAKIELPEILISADVQSRLGQLVDQTRQAGISVEQYLKSKNTTVDKYQTEVKEQVSKEWKLNLSIDKIAVEQKIEVSQKEIEELLSRNPQVATNINMLVYVMRQQKVLEYLQNLR